MKENKANKKGRKLLWGTVIITMILSFMFFYVLYCSNNKYMTREEKAIHGLLYADGSYESFPVYYLSREWEYYPDALLTPEDDLDKYYFRYISIGEYGGMELGNSGRSPYGSGTYRLKIMLPAEQHTYGLYLPEIFSAYNLYVDGVLVGQMGNPDMRIPIAYAFSYPERMDLSDVTQPLDLFSLKEGMSFYPADRSVFKTIDLAYEACREGGSCPVVLNGANEVLVDLFLHGKIRFIDIQNFLIQMMEAHQTKRNLDLETILEEDMRGREDVRKLVEKTI